MRLADLVVVALECDDREPHPAPDARTSAAGIFTAKQSIVVFPMSISVVATIARAGHTIGRTAFDSIAVPLVAAFVVGALLVVLTLSDPRARPRGLAGWGVTVLVAIVNSLVLFVAALGIEKF